MSHRIAGHRALAGAALAALALAPLSPAAHAQAGGGADRPRARAQGVQIRWLGHAAFEIVSPGGTRLLIDPWINGNPSVPDSLRPMARWTTGATKASAVLVTHAHSDHAADAKAIAQAAGAPVISVFEYVGSLQLPEAQGMGGNVGGRFTVGDVTVHLVPAMHSSEPGRPVGFVLDFPGGQRIYHTGDTWLFGDMALIQERYRPTIILLNAGGGPYTQGPADAALAVRKYFHPTTVIPMHYGTFPALATEAQVRAAFRNDSRLVVLRPGEMRTF